MVAWVPGANAASHAISINFVGGTVADGIDGGWVSNTPPYAGATGFKRVGWQNIVGKAANGVTLTDDQGSSTTARLTYSADHIYRIISYPANDDERMQRGYLGIGDAKTLVVTVGDVPYSRYWVAVYMGADVSDRLANVAVNTSAFYLKSLTVTGGGYVFPSYKLAVATSQGSADYANYAVFEELTNSALTLTFQTPGRNVGVQGFQILDAALFPKIVTAPLSQSVEAGATAALSVVATNENSLLLTYQWQFNGTNLLNATNATLLLTNVKLPQSGDYAVLVANEYGETVRRAATLQVEQVVDVFNPNAGGTVFTAVAQPDGKILVGGGFTTLGGQNCTNIGRLNADGTLDPSFNPGANDIVYSLALQEDGKILVGGLFTTLGGQARNYFGRLNPDGSLDLTFDPQASGGVFSLAVPPDGKILAGGWFTQIGGEPHNYIVRLNANGTVDSSLNAGADNMVRCMAVQADGKILVGGDFSTLNDQVHNRIGRLNTDGTVDTSFNPDATGNLCSLALQPDGKVVVGGYFTSLAGQPRRYIGRLKVMAAWIPISIQAPVMWSMSSPCKQMERFSWAGSSQGWRGRYEIGSDDSMPTAAWTRRSIPGPAVASIVWISSRTAKYW
jgi:uncharacterized delta-60 repeat protein